MRRISIVVGAGYGDEGKGLVTDYLVSRAQNPLVIRFNGGAQAGHTVVTPDGKRHVFHHYGSGTFLGTRTFYGPEFIFNPILARREQIELEKLGINIPQPIFDPECRITTPWDMMLNEWACFAQGVNKHGTCGVGINETMQREEAGFSFRIKDLDFDGEDGVCCIERKLEKIRREYVPMRMRGLGLEPCTFSNNDVQDIKIINRYCVDLATVNELAQTIPWKDISGWDGDFVFEGAQGLKLDMHHKNFPHVTHSKTGTHNARMMIDAMDLNKGKVDTYYVTRAYATRHGNGPFQHELKASPYPGIKDETNVENSYQGKLRYGLLDLNSLMSDIVHDQFEWAWDSLPMPRANLVVTCLDQLIGNDYEGMVRHVRNGQESATTITTFLEMMKNTPMIGRVFASYGPTRSTVF